MKLEINYKRKLENSQICRDEACAPGQPSGQGRNQKIF